MVIEEVQAGRRTPGVVCVPTNAAMRSSEGEQMRIRNLNDRL